MYRFFVVGSLLLLAGCQNVQGPLAHRSPERVDDPLLTISEQQRRVRDRLAIPDESPGISGNLAPRTYADRPDPHGR